MTEWIDTHCHLDAAEFLPDEADVRRRARDAGVRRCVVPAVAAAGFARVRALAHAHGDAYALGVHPLLTPQAGDHDLGALGAALDEAKLAAPPSESAEPQMMPWPTWSQGAWIPAALSRPPVAPVMRTPPHMADLAGGMLV